MTAYVENSEAVKLIEEFISYLKKNKHLWNLVGSNVFHIKLANLVLCISAFQIY